MLIVVGTTSKAKRREAEAVLRELLPEGEALELAGYSADSGVPETPWDDQTAEGARGRAVRTREQHPDADACIGIETGLVRRQGQVFEEVWCCLVRRDGRECFGYSSGLRVPTAILDGMEQRQLTHHEMMQRLEDLHGISRSETWGAYTGGVVKRFSSFREAVRNAVVQFVAPAGSFYRWRADARPRRSRRSIGRHHLLTDGSGTMQEDLSPAGLPRTRGPLLVSGERGRAPTGASSGPSPRGPRSARGARRPAGRGR